MLERKRVFNLVGPSQMFGALIELGIKRNHAAVGILQLPD